MARGERDRRGGGSNGRGRDGNPPREVQVSKKLSWLLRHGAEKEGLTLGPGGYINVNDVLNSRSIRPLKVTLSELSELVASNEKQRFSLIPVPVSDTLSPEPATEPAASPSDPTPNEQLPPSTPAKSTTPLALRDDDTPSHYLIRANQGHSIKLENDDLLTPITAEDAPVCVVHGTTRRAWPLIVSSGGLKPMGRNHVHFATGLPAGFDVATEGEEGKSSEPVISGMRNSSSILVYLNMEKAMRLGMSFWRSENGVILSDGGEKKLIPLDCFQRVEERGPVGGILVSDGVVVKNVSQGKPRRK